MGKRVLIEADGANTAGIDEFLEPYDIQCPYMQPKGRTSNNYWRSHCIMRLKMHENDDICGRCSLIGQKPNNILPTTNKRMAVPPEEAIKLGRIWFQMYKKGATFMKIAEKANCSQSAVRSYMCLAGYKPRKHQKTKG